MCVSMDTKLRGLPLTLTVSPLPNPILATSAERSDIKLSQRYSVLMSVNPITAEMSEIELPQRYNVLRLVNLITAEMSEIELFPRYSDVRLVSPATAEMSEIKLDERYSCVSLVNPATAEMSEIEFSLRASDAKLINSATAEMSEIELCERCSRVRLVACSSPVKSLMLEPVPTSWIKVAISDVVMASPGALPNVFSITARRLESGKSTTTPAIISSNPTVTPLL